MGRSRVRYDFLQVTDEMMDERAPALARLLTAAGRKTLPGEALRLILRLERYVVRRVSDDAADVVAEMHACALLPRVRAAHMLALATDWPESKAEWLIEALADQEVRVLEVVPEGWRVRGIAERYARFANERKASRLRTRDNARARAAGWEPGDGKTWQHSETGEVLPSLRDVVVRLDAGHAPPLRKVEGGAA
jgi:hypothetical protein